LAFVRVYGVRTVRQTCSGRGRFYFRRLSLLRVLMHDVHLTYP
jgi:hypothetical protein